MNLSIMKGSKRQRALRSASHFVENGSIIKAKMCFTEIHFQISMINHVVIRAM